MFSFISTVEPRALFNWMQAGERACLIDVRDREEFATAHTVGALSIPAHTVDADSIARLLDREAGCDSPIYLLSESGVRAEQVAYRLHRQGLLNAMPVEGGFARWRAEGLPHRRVERIPSIERQVWIAVGAVLLIVLAKAALLTPWFALLIGVLGVGLVIAGVDRSQWLAKWFCRMPWNRTRSPTFGY